MTNRIKAETILQEKDKRGIAILAHTYQNPEIISVADISGDSFKLAQAATELECNTVIVCGVRFMAETVKMLSPNKKVILATPEAKCAMAAQVTAEEIAGYKKENPDVTVCAYINTTANLKTEADVCVTSSSAVNICKKLGSDKILFVPDKNLGAFVKAALPEKEIILWDGCCPIHNALTANDVEEMKSKHPDALFAVHPEAPAEVAALADYVGATSGIIDFCLKKTTKDVIIGTERGVCDYLSQKYPDREFYQLAPEKLVCPDMKYTTLDRLLEVVLGNGGEEIVLDESLRKKARQSIDKMLELG